MPDRLLHYFAYGSNLYLPRMQARVPSARPLALARVDGYELHFHKRGADGSGKCNIVLTGDGRQTVHGCIYTMRAAERAQLDAVEIPDYRPIEIEVASAEGPIRAFTYQAPLEHTAERLRPFDWYLALVVVGASQHGLPEHYVRRLAQVETLPDPDFERDRANRYGSL